MGPGISIPGLTVNSNGGGLRGGQSISFGGGSPLPITNQAILGTETTATAPTNTNTGRSSNTGSNGGNSYQQQYNAAGHQGIAPVGYHGESGPNGAASSGNPSIDDIYNPLISNLDSMSGQLTSNRDTDLGNLATQYQGQQKAITDQLAGLNNTLQGNQAQFGQQTQSAYTQAIKNYNNLKNQYMSMFGGGSSAGPAAMQILSGATQEAMGNLQTTQLNGNQQLAQQGLDINTWGDTQNNQITSWYNDAQDKLKGTYANGIAAINSDKAMAEADKAQAKLELLNQVVQHQSALQDYATQLQGQMAVYQSMGGGPQMTAFDQSQMSNTMSALGQQLAQAPQGLQQLGQLPQAQSQQYNGYVPGLYNYGQQTNTPGDPMAQFVNSAIGKTG